MPKPIAQITRYLCAVFIWLSCAYAGQAQNLSANEYIAKMDVTIDVAASGKITVVEQIDYVKPVGVPKRGIFRDLPRYMFDDGKRLTQNYKLLSVSRDGQTETVVQSREGGALRWRLGKVDKYLSEGPHRYIIQYSLEEAIWRQEEQDLFFWNVTGHAWPFPIAKAKTRILLPDAAAIKSITAYTGPHDSQKTDARVSSQDNLVVISSKNPLAPGEGLSVKIALEKGGLTSRSPAGQMRYWLRKNALLLSLIILPVLWLIYAVMSWQRVGRDPAKLPVFARYEPPENYSAAAAHQILYNKVKDDKALIAALLSLAIHGWIDITTRENETYLHALPYEDHKTQNIPPEYQTLFEHLFTHPFILEHGSPVVLKADLPNPYFHTAREKFEQELARRYGEQFFKQNLPFFLGGLGASVLCFFIIMHFGGATEGLEFGALILSLIGGNMIFRFLIAAPTALGAKVKAEIKGFKLYLETAEKLRLNTAEIGTDETPPMSVEHYEAYLPYAVALGVEEPWSTHFENAIPALAKNHQIQNVHYGNHMIYRGFSTMQQGLMQALSSSVTSAAPVSRSSSGGGSGGGGGGGGGGSW